MVDSGGVHALEGSVGKKEKKSSCRRQIVTCSRGWHSQQKRNTATLLLTLTNDERSLSLLSAGKTIIVEPVHPRVDPWTITTTGVLPSGCCSISFSLTRGPVRRDVHIVLVKIRRGLNIQKTMGAGKCHGQCSVECIIWF